MDVCGKDSVRAAAELVEKFSFLQERLFVPDATAMTYPDKQFKFDDKQKQSLRDALTIRGYSVKTMRVYNAQVRRFSIYVQEQQLEGMTHPVQGYSLFLLQQGYSHAYVNQAISALKFYFQRVLHHQETAPYMRPKKENKLPNVLSLEEVMLVLKAVNNLKHQALLYLTYSSGLRVGEVVRLRIGDCDPSRKILLVRQGKGRKDQITLLSDAAYEIVRKYI